MPSPTVYRLVCGKLHGWVGEAITADAFCPEWLPQAGKPCMMRAIIVVDDSYAGTLDPLGQDAAGAWIIPPGGYVPLFDADDHTT